jgi:hypothetical protein
MLYPFFVLSKTIKEEHRVTVTLPLKKTTVLSPNTDEVSLIPLSGNGFDVKQVHFVKSTCQEHFFHYPFV